MERGPFKVRDVGEIEHKNIKSNIKNIKNQIYGVNIYLSNIILALITHILHITYQCQMMKLLLFVHYQLEFHVQLDTFYW